MEMLQGFLIMHSRTGQPWIPERPADRFKIGQPYLCPSHCKVLAILSILQFPAADNQLGFVHHQAFRNYSVYFATSEKLSIGLYHHNDKRSVNGGF